MIDPTTVTKYDRDDYSLQEVALFWICAAGKNGRVAAKLLDHFLTTHAQDNELPFDTIKRIGLDALPLLLKQTGIGCQQTKSRAMIELAQANFDLRTCSVDELETIHGIGMKTARCFLMHSRPHMHVAALDTHILKYLRAQGIDAPLGTPSRKKYLELEQEFLRLAQQSGKSVADFDLDIWNTYSVVGKD